LDFLLVERIWIVMGGIGEIDARIETIPNEESAFAKLRSAVVYRVHLKAVHVIPRAVKALQVFGESADYRTWLFVFFKCIATLFGPLGYVPVTKSGRKKTANVFHQEHTRFHLIYEPKKLPKQRPSRVLNSCSPAHSAKRLARWTSDEQVNFPRFESNTVEDFVRVDGGNIALEYHEVSGKSPGFTI
jgi:hypothetical protein